MEWVWFDLWEESFILKTITYLSTSTPLSSIYIEYPFEFELVFPFPFSISFSSQLPHLNRNTMKNNSSESRIWLSPITITGINSSSREKANLEQSDNVWLPLSPPSACLLNLCLRWSGFTAIWDTCLLEIAFYSFRIAAKMRMLWTWLISSKSGRLSYWECVLMRNHPFSQKQML